MSEPTFEDRQAKTSAKPSRVADPVEPASGNADRLADTLSSSYATPAKHTESPRVRRSKQVRFVRSTLVTMAASAEGALARVEETSEFAARDALVAGLASEISVLGLAVRDVLDELEPDECRQFKKEANRLAAALTEISAWIDKRNPMKRMSDAYASTNPTVEAILERVGVARLHDRKDVPKRGEAHEGEKETQTVVEVAGTLATAIEAHGAQIAIGIQLFSEQARIVDPEEPEEFIAMLARTLMVAALGHIVGELGDRLARKLLTYGLEPLKDLATDWTQGITAELFAKANQAAERAPSHDRARAYFVAGLSEAAVLDVQKRKDAVARKVARKAVSPVELDHAREAIDDAKADVVGIAARHAATAWASYLAQARLGTHRGTRDPSGREASNMNEYFGRSRPDGERESSTGKQGTHGVARKFIGLVPGDVLVVQPRALEVAGLNSELASMIGGGKRLDQLSLPKELHLGLPGDERVVIAIDEQNRVRDVLGWEAVLKTFPSEAMLATPTTFWAHVRGWVG